MTENSLHGVYVAEVPHDEAGSSPWSVPGSGGGMLVEVLRRLRDTAATTTMVNPTTTGTTRIAIAKSSNNPIDGTKASIG